MHTHPLALAVRAFLIIVSILSASVSALAQGSDEGAVVSGFYGSLGTSVPIAVPEYHALEPPLSLQYSSSGPNGWLGVGWSLGGLSTIQRGSDRGGAPEFTTNDRHFLDGQELVPSTVLGGTHCTRIQSFLRCEFDGTNWFVTGKSGTRSTYSALFQSSLGAYRWYVTETVDVHGNTVDYHYAVEQGLSASVYIETIEYNGVVIRFRRNTRSDPVPFGMGAAVGHSVKRLTSIDVLVGGVRARTYRLDYEQSPLNGRSQLIAVTQFGRDAIVSAAGAVTGGTSLPPMAYEYAAGEASMTDEGVWGAGAPTGNTFSETGRIRSGDFDGDGKNDLLYGPSGSGDWKVALSTGTTLGPGGSGPMFADWAVAKYSNWSGQGTRSARIRVADVNGDGMSDVVLGPDSSGRWFVLRSTGTAFADEGEWISSSQYGSYYSSNAQASSQMSIRDVNGDGKADIVLGLDGAGIIYVLKSTGLGFEDLGIWFFDSSFDDWWEVDKASSRVRLVDMTGDGLPDYLIGPDDNGRWWVLRNKRSFFAAAEEWITSSPYGGTWSNNTTAGARIRNADVNGDGLADIVVGPDGSGSWFVVLNTGTSLIDDGAWITNSGYQYWANNDTATARVKLIDVNGDRMADVTMGPDSAGAFYVLTSRGTGFTNQGAWITSAFPGFSMLGGLDWNDNARVFLRSADVTGDGVNDFVYGPDSNGVVHVVRVGTRDNPGGLIETIHNGIGGWSEILYEPSSTWDLASLPMGMVVQTVGSVTTHDGRSNSGNTSYQYEGALWSFTERRFLGFRTVRAVINDDGDYVETIYHQHDGAVSKPSQVRFKDAGGITYSRTSYDYTANNAPPFTSLMTSMVRAELDVGGNSTSTHRFFGYDAYGNVAWVKDLGSLQVSGDETLETFIHVPNLTDYVVSSPARIVRHEGQFPTDPVISDVRYFYDFSVDHMNAPVKGNATEVRKWDSGDGGFVKSRQGYDAYGNVTIRSDEEGKITSQSYDPIYHVYPTTETNPLGHSATRTWDYVLGAVEHAVDSNQTWTHYEYDALGRPYRTTGPDGYEEVIEYFDTGDPNQQRVRTSVKRSTTNGITDWSEVYLDGLGRTWLSKRVGPSLNSPNDQWIRTRTDYAGTSGRAERSSYPAYNGDPLIWTEFEYDRRDRLRRTTHPDGKYVTIDYEITSDSRVKEDRVDEAGDRLTTYKDVHGQIVEVVEYEGSTTFSTLYEYDSSKRLIRITDSRGNVTRMFWDSLNRKVMTLDPDMGVLTYDHDDRGLLIESVDNKGQVSTVTYDDLGRMILRMTDGQFREGYRYDEDDNGASVGRLTETVYAGGSMIHKYDAQGRIIEDKIRVGAHSRAFHKTFDLTGRLESLTYPDGETDVFSYDLAGNLSATSAMVPELRWSADNRLEFARFADGTTESYSYDPNRRWLNTAVFKDLQGAVLFNSAYTYDHDGKVLTVSSSTHPSDSATYGYDGLGRLRTVTGSKKEAFTYDSIGNMRSNVGVGRYYYDGGGSVYAGANAGPHAVTKIQTPDGVQLGFKYDGNGNLIDDSRSSYTWDVDDRLVGAKVAGPHGSFVTSTFDYDAAGNRIRESVGTHETLYFGGLYEVSLIGGTVVEEIKTYSAGQRPVGRRVVGSPNADALHCDRLNSVKLVTDGAVKQDLSYLAFGEVKSQTSGVAIEQAYGGHRLDGQTGLTYMKARYYDAHFGRFISPDTIVPSPYDPQSLNRYSYVLNNPIANTDPTGHAPVAVIISAALVTTSSASLGLVTLAWIGAATTTIGYINEDPELIAIGQILTGFASGVAGVGVAKAWGGGLSGGLTGASLAYSQSPISPLSPRARIAVGWAFAEWGNYGTLADGDLGNIDAIQGTALRRLAIKLGVQRAEEQTGMPAGSVNMAVNALVGLKKAALWMRKSQISGMMDIDRQLARAGQSNGVRSWWGEKLEKYATHLAGTRTHANGAIEPGWLGGAQSGPGLLFTASYDAGSAMDGILEAMAGPHDFFNSPWYYDAFGRNAAGPDGLLGFIHGLANWVNIVPALPFGAGTLLAPPEVYWNTNY